MAICLSVGAGLLATCLSLLGAICLLLWFWDHAFGRWLLRFAGPFIAVPPTAVAAGLILFLAPSGWLMRLISPELTGFTRPPLGAVSRPTWIWFSSGAGDKRDPLYSAVMLIRAGACARPVICGASPALWDMGG